MSKKNQTPMKPMTSTIKLYIPTVFSQDQAEDFAELLLGHLNYQTLSVLHFHGGKFEIQHVLSGKSSTIIRYDVPYSLSVDREQWPSLDHLNSFLRDFFLNMEMTLREGTPARQDGTRNIEGTDSYAIYLQSNWEMRVFDSVGNAYLLRFDEEGSEPEDALYSTPESMEEALAPFLEGDKAQDASLIKEFMTSHLEAVNALEAAHAAEIAAMERAHKNMMEVAQNRHNRQFGIIIDEVDRLKRDRDSLRKLLGLKKIRE